MVHGYKKNGSWATKKNGSWATKSFTQRDTIYDFNTMVMGKGEKIRILSSLGTKLIC